MVTVFKKPVSKKVKSDPDIHFNQPLTTSMLLYSTDIDPEWFKKDPWQDGWKSKILPTLCLVTGVQTNIWYTPKSSIISFLALIIPIVFPDLTTFTCTHMQTQKCVRAVLLQYWWTPILFSLHTTLESPSRRPAWSHARSYHGHGWLFSSFLELNPRSRDPI